jgi:hypothetical protein
MLEQIWLPKPAREQGRETGPTNDGAFLTPEQLELLTEIESRDNIFAEIDYRIYCSV